MGHCSSNGFGGMWIIIIIILLFACCGNERSGKHASGFW